MTTLEGDVRHYPPLALDTMYNKIEDGEISLDTPEGRRECRMSIRYALNLGLQDDVDEFYSNVVGSHGMDQPGNYTILDKAIKFIGTLSLTLVHGGMAYDFRVGFNQRCAVQKLQEKIFGND